GAAPGHGRIRSAVTREPARARDTGEGLERIGVPLQISAHPPIVVHTVRAALVVAERALEAIGEVLPRENGRIDGGDDRRAVAAGIGLREGVDHGWEVSVHCASSAMQCRAQASAVGSGTELHEGAY